MPGARPHGGQGAAAAPSAARIRPPEMLPGTSGRKSPLTCFLRSYSLVGRHVAHSMTHTSPGKARPAAQGRGGVFPVLPPPRWIEPAPKSARRRARIRLGVAASKWAERVFGVGSWHALGRPRRCPNQLPHCSSDLHFAAWDRVRSHATHLIRASWGLSQEAGGRRSQALLQGLRDQELLLLQVGCCELAYDRAVATSARSGLAAAGGCKPVVASRLAIPQKGCYWKLADYLEGEVRRAFEAPSSLRDGTVRSGPTPLRPRMFGSRVEVRAVFERLDNAGMLYLARRSEIPSGPNGEAIVSAFFAFPKTEGTDRTIQIVVARTRWNVG